MHALLLIAHGSRRSASNDEVRDLAHQLSNISNGKFSCVIPAFLELAEPDIPKGVDLCVEAGADEITVLPYFLSAGRHVVEDIPEDLNKAKEKHSGIKINLCRHIGKHPDMMKLMMNAAANMESELD